MNNKYDCLLKILDALRKEAPEQYKNYHPLDTDIQKVNSARSKALIHLYLKVKFGILNFKEREANITEGPGDGGIDAYMIDNSSKIIYFIQSKFRTTQNTFESKEIALEELLSMDIDRITEGENKDINDSTYNSKILNLIKLIQNIQDIGRYKYQIIIIANTKEIPQNKLKKLSDGNPVEIFNYEKVYNDLVFPLISGTFFQQSELVLELNLGQKTSDEITYSVETEFGDCEISALFVPTIEIAKTLYKYKNSILKYNPRSYLDMASGSTNSEIAKTIIEKATNEFALFNNGITMLSDSTNINKRIGKKGCGHVFITNPQIINGGQTAYTLSRIYDDVLETKYDESIFEGKEVLLKIITIDDNSSQKDKLQLIEAISKATNQQTAVNEADRRSNDKVQIDLQNNIYNNYGLFYQRKAGEFGEGLKNKYIDRRQIVDREELLRIALAINGEPSQARRTGGNTLFKKQNFERILNDSTEYNKLIIGHLILSKLVDIQNTFAKIENNRDGIINFGHALRYGKYAVIYAILKSFPSIQINDIDLIINYILRSWLFFEQKEIDIKINSSYFREIEDDNKKIRQQLNFDGFYKGNTINNRLKSFNFKTFDITDTDGLSTIEFARLLELFNDSPEKPINIYIPKSTQKFFSTSEDIALDYLALATVGQILAEASTTFEYSIIQPHEHKNVSFEITPKDSKKFSEVLQEVSAFYTDNPPNEDGHDDFYVSERMEQFLQDVENNEPTCSYFYETYIEYNSEANLEEE